MLQEGLVLLLVADGGVSAILATRATSDGSTLSTNGLFPNDLPEGEPLPAIVYSDIHAANEMTLDGPDPFTESRIEFSCRAKDYATAKKLARAVRQALENFTGTLGDGEATQVDSMHRVSEIDNFEFAPFDHRTHLDVMIAFRELQTGVSSYQPPNPPQFQFSDDETPAGAINGSNAVFTLAHTPNPAASLMLVLNGAVQQPGDDYTLSGSQITFSTAPPANSNLEAWYRY